MKKILIVCLSFSILFAFKAEAAPKIPAKTLNTVVTVVTGLLAVKATGEAVEQADVVQEKDNILESLKVQGLLYDDAAIYSLYFDLNSDASCVYWADFNKPDIFALIQIEGVGDYIVPRISYEYCGQPILDRVVCQEIQPGREVIVHFMDDDTFSDTIWNNILQTKVDYRIDLNANASSQERNTSKESNSSAAALMQVSVTASGQIQLLKSPQVLDSQDYIASMRFKVPNSPDGVWAANGKIIDSKGREVGNARFSQIWKPRVPSPKAKVIMEDQGKAKNTMIIWGGIAIVCVAVFIKFLFFKTGKNENQ